MKRKQLIKNNTELADLLNKLDGLRTNITRAEFRKAIKLINSVDIACRVRGYKSVTAMMGRWNAKKAMKMRGK